MPELHGGLAAVDLGPGYSIQAPGLRGTIEAVDDPRGLASRGASGVHDEPMLRAMEQADVSLARMFELEVGEEAAPSGGGDRGGGLTLKTRSGEPALRFQAPDPGASWDSAVLYTDEIGRSRWVFSEGAAGTGEPREFRLPLYSEKVRSEKAPSESDGRGPIAKLGRRVVRVLVWATDRLVGPAVQELVTRWEVHRRPYQLRGVAGGVPSGAPDWDALAGRRSLLLVHGTFSTAEDAFGGLLASPEYPEIEASYGGRVLAFDHPSLHVSPLDNARKLLDWIPSDRSFELDVVCHSRGGLVTRELIDRAAAERKGSLAIRRAVFVGSPHGGTCLVDGDHVLDFIDHYTNLLTNLPDGVALLSFEGVLAVVKLAAHGALHGLPGLQSMLPGGAYLGAMNARGAPGAEYRAIAGSLDGDPGSGARGLARRALARVARAIFGADNDGVVPTEGCYDLGRAASGFPIPEPDRLVLAGGDVDHVSYFHQDPARRQIARWLCG